MAVGRGAALIHGDVPKLFRNSACGAQELATGRLQYNMELAAIFPGSLATVHVELRI